ncbi:hypothetical protein WN943_014982 [Citrus x changshan-huyou]
MDEVDEVKELNYLEEANFKENNEELEEKVARGWSCGCAAVLRADDGSLICKLREGVGKVTHNVAEYRGLILGLKYALEKGFFNIHVRGDSKLVCCFLMQVVGLWKTKHHGMAELCGEAKTKMLINFFPSRWLMF